MKHTTMLALLAALPLCSCAQETTNNQTDTATMNSTNKALVAYFSATGTTKGVPFATSGGSGMGDSTANLQALAPDAKVVEGKRFPASVSAEDLKKWAAGF